MSISTPERTEVAEPEPLTAPSQAGEAMPVEAGGVADGAFEEPTGIAPAAPVALAATLSMGAAAFMVAGLFKGLVGRGVAVAAVAVGAGIVLYSVHSRRRWIQALVLPVAAVLGALLTVPEATGRGSANLIDLVVEAVQSGGILQPPIPFDPGWRFILVVAMAALGAGVAAVAIGVNRPKLAVILPVPLAMGAELVQPPGAEVWPTAVALVLMVAALGVAYGAELISQGVVVSSGFEVRRLGRTAVMILGLLVAVVVLAQLNLLFPQSTNNSRIIPPQRPKLPPPEPDRPLFTYRIDGDRKLPLRLGTIDIYDQKLQAWLLPPYDPSRFKDVPEGGDLPGATRRGATTFSADITVADAQGHLLPDIAAATRVTGISDRINFDPRTETLRLTDARVAKGMKYKLTIPIAPSGRDLGLAPVPNDNVKPFLDAPPPPPEVVALLKNAPKDSFDRMEVLRNALYTRVVAAGVGKPVDLPVSRVVDMLNGKEASPYEITAGEALLTRWAGVPSRIGYGYYGGQKVSNSDFEVRPKNGATWLEAYFEGFGWVPIVGVPQQARASTSDTTKNDNPSVRPTDDVGLVVYVPVRFSSPLQYFQIVSYWVMLFLPYVLAALAAYIVFPGFVKLARAVMRRRYAAVHGPRMRILVAYAEFRDVANDLTYGDPLATPLEYLEAAQEDPEHQELAWLVTRTLWGDLQRDPDPRHARRAEELSRSLLGRAIRAQSVLSMALAFIARTSLRDPYSIGLPNPWPRPRPRRAAAPTGYGRRPRLGAREGLLSRVRGRVPGLLGRLLPGAAATLALLVLAGCGQELEFHGPTTLPSGLVPDHIGTLAFQRSPSSELKFVKAGSDSLASRGQVWLVRHDDVVEGSVQVSLIKPDVRVNDVVVWSGMDTGIGGAHFQRVRLVPDQESWAKELTDVRVFMWFPPGANSVELVILRKSFKPYTALVTDLINIQHGRAAKPFVVPTPTAAPAVPAAPATPPPGGVDLGNLAGEIGVPSGSPSPSGTPR